MIKLSDQASVEAHLDDIKERITAATVAILTVMLIGFILGYLFMACPAAKANSIDNFTFRYAGGDVTWQMQSVSSTAEPFWTVATFADGYGILDGSTGAFAIEATTNASGVDYFNLQFNGFVTQPAGNPPDPVNLEDWDTWFLEFFGTNSESLAVGNIWTVDSSGNLDWIPGNYGALTIVDPPAETLEPSTLVMLLCSLFLLVPILWGRFVQAGRGK